MWVRVARYEGRWWQVSTLFTALLYSGFVRCGRVALIDREGEGKPVSTEVPARAVASHQPIFPRVSTPV